MGSSRRKKEASRLVQWMRKSKSPVVQTLLWLPTGFMPFYWAFFTRKPRELRRKVLKRPGGKYPDRKFYIVRLDASTWGLAALEPLIAANCAKAEAIGYTPVVDLLHSSTIYHAPDESGRVNVWDNYYEQPCGYSLEEAMQGQHVVLGCSDRAYLTFFKHWYFGNPANRDRSYQVFSRYIRLNEKTQSHVEAESRTLIPQGERILGVICRGTDYIGTRPEGHYIPPTAEEAILRAKQLMEKRGLTRIFLATEDANVLRTFQNAFPTDQLIINEALRFTMEQGKLIADYEAPAIREYDRYKRGLEYLTTLTLLSRCQ